MGMFFITFLVMATIVLIMAVGVIFGHQPIKGSCGGLNKIGLDGKCEICGREPKSCDSNKGAVDEKEIIDSMEAESNQKNSNYQLGYDAFSQPKKDSEL